MRKFAILGEHLSHTLSPKLYNTLFKRHGIDATYSVIEIPKRFFDDQVEDEIEDLDGFNVTIPYKNAIISHLRSVSSSARKIEAVNAVNYRKHGFNTDWKGFRSTLEEVEMHGPSALVIGAGGAARAICHALQGMGLLVYLRNRHPERANEMKERFGVSLGEPDLSDLAIVVNATPLGMYPSVDTMPDVELSRLPRHCVAYDLVYNPRPTKFLRTAKNLGLRTIDGSEMLVGQAILNLKMWSMEEPANDLAEDHSWIFED